MKKPSKAQRNKDMKKLEKLFFEYLVYTDGDGTGIGLDCKRPFGNSSFYIDILECIAAKPEDDDDCYSEEQEEYALSLYYDLVGWLKAKYA